MVPSAQGMPSSHRGRGRRTPWVVVLTLLGWAMLGASGAAAGAATPARASFAIQPIGAPEQLGYFVFDAQPGATIRGTVRIVNVGDASGTALLYAVDATTGQTSGIVYQSAQAPRLDTGAWITLGLSKVTLDPGQGRIVPFQVRIPEEVRPAQHVGGIVAENATLTTTSPQASTSGASVQIRVQDLTIVAVQVNLPRHVVQSISVTGAQPGGSHGQQTVLLGLSNAGTEIIKPKGSLEITTDRGDQVEELPLALDSFLPGTRIDYPVLIRRALPPGTYRATVALTYGQDGVTRATVAFGVSAAQVAQVFGSRSQDSPATTTGASSAILTVVLGSGWLLLALLGAAYVRRRRKRVLSSAGP